MREDDDKPEKLINWKKTLISICLFISNRLINSIADEVKYQKAVHFDEVKENCSFY